MKVFIDANIFLAQYSGLYTKASSLKQLLDLIQDNKIEVIVTKQVKDEVYRNKERLILGVKDDLKKLESELKKEVPAKRKGLPVLESIINAMEDYNKKVFQEIEELSELVEENISPGGEIDNLIESILNSSENIETSPTILNLAKYRHEIGNPPMKPDNSIGDAINWEILLSVIKKEDNFVIISNDNDFKVTNWKGELTLQGFLLTEWEKRVGSRIKLFKSVPDFLLSLPKEAKINSNEISKAKAEEDLVSQYLGDNPYSSTLGNSSITTDPLGVRSIDSAKDSPLFKALMKNANLSTYSAQAIEESTRQLNQTLKSIQSTFPTNLTEMAEKAFLEAMEANKQIEKTIVESTKKLK